MEEKIYVKQQDQSFFEKKKMEIEQKKKDEEMKQYNTIVAPVMREAAMVIEQSNPGTKVNHNTLEALAKWKLGHKG
jgi:hypothetical protein